MLHGRLLLFVFWMLAFALGCAEPDVELFDAVTEPRFPSHPRLIGDRKATPAGLQTEMDSRISPMITGGKSQAVVAGVITPKGVYFASYGQLSHDNPTRPNMDTLFEIGSITKTFTSLLLALEVEKGKLALNQAAQTLLPDDVSLPQVTNQPIMLLHLATHSSGLPRDPANWGQGFAKERLYEALNALDATSVKAPGQYAYSNLGVGLLGHLLELHHGQSYTELLLERITGPLGMPNTKIDLEEEDWLSLATGSWGDGTPIGLLVPSVMNGAGIIRSSAYDMLTYLAAQVGLLQTPLSTAMQLTTEPKVLFDWNLVLGLGWHLSLFEGLASHGGLTDGYMSAAFIHKKSRIGVIVLETSIRPPGDANVLVDEAAHGIATFLVKHPEI